MLDENDPSLDEEEETLQPDPDQDTEKDTENDDKNKKSISADLIRGHINTIILRSLFDGDRYGYDIINEIEQKSHGQYSLKQPTLYSALKRLEAQGYVRSYWGGVSNGGRRRYFSLTDAGKDVVKQNQSEWEYSRTIIDNLISDEDFDFSKPVPQKLDFRILRQSTSRTPIVTEGEQPRAESDGETEQFKAEQQPAEQPIEPPIDPLFNSFGGYAPALNITVTEPSPEEIQPQIQPQMQQQMQPLPQQPQQQEPLPQEAQAQAESVKAETTERPLPLYSSLSEEERNYKDIIGKIYKNSIRQTRIPVPQPQEPQETQGYQAETRPAQPTQPTPIQPTQPSAPQTQPIEPVAPLPAEQEEAQAQAKPQPQEPPTYEREPKQTMETPSESIKKIDFRDLKRQAEADGLRVWIAGNSKKNSIPEDFFNKGASLLKSSLFFFAAAIVESLLVILFKDDLFASSASMIAYIAVMLSVTVAVPAVCAVLYLLKYAPCCRRLKKPIPVETGVVLFLAAFILLVAIDLLVGIKMTDIPLLFTSLIIPGVYLLNIILFAGVYYLFSKSKI